ncbi:amino acid/amide ABC transporter substrate-binding protein, HAAT family (TC 3.A.1.4.-) [Gulbenkiania indica]|uniref:Amino acid/amide ABC transporter substrate-binding protein, HAAT family (TC 3.A.1.4.-) n=1 Tax=Gulbenkiania indica TaxID=375574 RepID=A0A0K6H1S4_9NEIS|nr:branched-chain amino acid ABC transporter substrate-binding protein [Gulbenkiania indica]CUA84776.1 amino acid/amide ABC transporter substrate-binding protein, HAAT family (TC 3.A.1.4.-) [Gulbenkiania indica]
MFIYRTTLIAAAVAALAACSQQSDKPEAAASEPTAAAASGGELVVKIGSANPLTGPFAHWGRDSDNGVKLAAEEANAEKIQLDGKTARFEVVSEDDQADPKVATQVAQRFVDGQVAGVIGHLTSGASIPASRIYSEAGIPMVAASVTSPKFTQQGYKNTFRIIANDLQQGQALAKFAVGNLKVKRIAIIDDRTTYGQGLADDFAKAVETAGGTVVKREYTSNSATDFMAILTSIKGEKPELIFYGGMDAQAGPMVKQMKKIGLTVPFMGADGVNTAEFVKLGGKDAEGTYASSAGASKAAMPGFASFNDKFKKAFNADIQAYAPYTYDATRVLIDAMKRAGSATPAKYLPELAKTQFEGVTGPIAFDEKGDIKNGSVTLYQLKNGQWAEVGAPAPAAASAAQ